MAILSSNQITFVDITDQRKLSAYLTSNKTTIQIYDTDNSTYNPSWSFNSLVITPQIFIDQTAIDLSDQNLNVIWKRKDGNNEEMNLSTGESVSGKILTVSANKLGDSSSDMLTYICHVTYNDVETEQSINATTQLTYTLIRTANKTKSCSISGAQIFKYDKNNVIISDSQITLTAFVQNVNISAWQYYNETTSSYINYPTTSDNSNITSATLIVKPNHDVFFNGVAKIKLKTSDPEIYDILSITKLYDGQEGEPGAPGSAGVDAYTVYLTNESHTFAGTTTNATASNVETQVVAYKGTTQQNVTITKVNGVNASVNQTNTGITGLQFKVSSTSATASPTVTFYALTSLTKKSGVIPITFTIGDITFTKNFSWSIAFTGSGACSVSISASSQIFKSSDGVSFTPDTIVLTPTVQNLSVGNCAWEYSINGGTSYTSISSTTTSTTAPYINNSTKVLNIPKGWTVFSNTITTVVLKCKNGSYSDTMTICRLSDGQSATAAYTVILSNENQTIATDTSLRPLETKTYNCIVQVYEGSTLLTPTLNTPVEGTFKVILPTNPSGITLGQTTAGEVTFTTSTANIINTSGLIELTIQIESTSNTVTKSISYSAAKSGTDGSSSVILRVYSLDGTVFNNQLGSITLSTSAYVGSTPITSGATYQWAKHTSSGWINIANATNSTYTVNGSDVINIQSYRCTMTYGGQPYQDVITIQDKTDTYVSEMLTVGGTTFKNGQGGSFAYIITRANGVEKDPLLGVLSTVIKQNYETTPTNYYYYLNNTNGTIQLYKYVNSAWRTSSDTQSLTYTWSLMDRLGNADNFNNGSSIKTGKIIYLSCNDIDGTGTLQCDITD